MRIVLCAGKPTGYVHPEGYIDPVGYIEGGLD